MSSLRKKTAELLIQSSKNLAQFVPMTAFEFWQRNDFRLFIDFSQLSRSEQDRIFNELEVSLLGFIDLYLTYITTIIQPEYKKTITIIQKEFTNSFLELLSKNRVEEKYIQLWQSLIDMRLKEYWEDYKVGLKETSSWDEFKNDRVMKITWARIETITIVCLTHIRRGKVEKNDPLWKLLRQWLIKFNADLMPLENLIISS